MAGKPIWKGSTQLTEGPTSPLYEHGQDGPRITRTFSGPYVTVMAALPKRLQAVRGNAPGFWVDSIRVEKTKGALGILTITLTPSPSNTYSFEPSSTPPSDDPFFYEVEWVECSKAIETHPIFNPAAGSSAVHAGQYVLTTTDLEKVEVWRNAGSESSRAMAYGALSDNAKVLVDKLKRGTTSYVVYAPVCRKTSRFPEKPTSQRCGIREDPPGIIKVDGYKYLKTADRVSRDGRLWVRVQEWTGAEYVDEDLYST